MMKVQLEPSKSVQHEEWILRNNLGSRSEISTPLKGVFAVGHSLGVCLYCREIFSCDAREVNVTKVTGNKGAYKNSPCVVP